jgi:hypothetical protein
MRLAVPFVKESTRAAEMAKKVERLSAMAVAKASESGLYADGAGPTFASVGVGRRAGHFDTCSEARRAKWAWAD